jgi:hypothetical protein
MIAKAEVKYFLSLNSSFERLGTEAIPFFSVVQREWGEYYSPLQEATDITFLAHAEEKRYTGTVVLLDLPEEKKANWR